MTPIVPNASESFRKRNPHLFHENPPRIELPDAQSSQPAPALDRQDARETQSARVPLVRFTLRRVRLLDVDAKYASVKDLLDGLQAASLVDGDAEGQIRLEVNQEKVRHRSQERTVIEIEY